MFEYYSWNEFNFDFDEAAAAQAESSVDLIVEQAVTDDPVAGDAVAEAVVAPEPAAGDTVAEVVAPPEPDAGTEPADVSAPSPVDGDAPTLPAAIDADLAFQFDEAAFDLAIAQLVGSLYDTNLFF